MSNPARRLLNVAACAIVFATTALKAEVLDEIVVTSERRAVASQTAAASISALGSERIRAVGAQHAHTLLTRVPGAWLSRGSGQESLPAIRSPVLAGAGACGAILTLEDGIPTRPPGFCNVNQLFELNTEQAAAVEVLRGPGSILYGSNALHGLVNVIMPGPGSTGYAALGAGPHDFRRAQLAAPLGAPRGTYGSILYASDGGFRDDTGYRQYKAYATTAVSLAGGDARLAFSATNLDQQTGGYVQGKDAYRDPVLRLSNPNPEAFREAASQRLYAIWTRNDGSLRVDLRPYLRHSDMTFLQHFLPGQPLEKNAQASAGLLALAEHADGNTVFTAGADLDLSASTLEETQDGLAEGSPFLVATRPPGKHYDYSVTAVNLGAYVHWRWSPTPAVDLAAGLRAESSWYDYDNRMLDGNTRDDGEPCDFGGCLYTRPSDRSDRFTDLAPHFSVAWSVNDSLRSYLRLARGFRPPQTTELYRLQSGQTTADLDSEKIDSVEAGLKYRSDRWSADVAAFAMRKWNSVLRDADGFNISDGKSRHSGVELGIDALLGPAVSLSVAGSYAKHTYAFDRVAAQGETFVSGRDVDTAPRWLGSIELTWLALERLELSLQWTAIGEYFVDAENAHDYPGHRLWNGTATVELGPSWLLFLRLDNIADTRYADRADYAFGNYRYFPGRGRELSVEVRYAPAGD